MGANPCLPATTFQPVNDRSQAELSQCAQEHEDARGVAITISADAHFLRSARLTGSLISPNTFAMLGARRLAARSN